MLDYIIEKYGEGKMLCCGACTRGLDYYTILEGGDYDGWGLFFSFITPLADPEVDYPSYVTPTVKEVTETLDETTICIDKNKEVIVIYPRKEYNDYQKEKNL